MPLGDDLDNLASSILALIQKTNSLSDKIALRRQLTTVLEETERIIGANVDTATQQYKDATDGIGAANAAIRNALGDLGKVADAIVKIAEAINFVVNVAALAGAFG